MKLHLRLIYFLFIYLMHVNNFKICGPLMVHGWSLSSLNCCKSNCCSGSSTTDSDKSKSSKSSDASVGSGFELNIKSDNFKSDDEHFDLQQSFSGGFCLITFKRRVSCSLVKVDDKEVWKYESGDYPKTVRYYKNDKKVYVEFSHDKSKIYKQDGDKWKEETQDSTQKSGTDGSGGGGTPASPTSRGGTTGTDGSGGSTETGGGTGTGGGGGTDQSGGGTTGTGGSGGSARTGGGGTGTRGGGGTQQSTPASPTSGGGKTGTDSSGDGSTKNSTPSTQ